MLSWKPIAGLAVALVLAVLWGLYERRTAQLEAERAEALSRQVAALTDAVRRQEREAAIRQSITDAADRAVVSVEAGRDVIRGRVVTIVREVQRAQDCHDPVGPALRAAFERLRVIDREPGADRRDAGGSAGSAAGPSQGAAPPRGAVTNCQAGEYLVRLYEWGRGLEGQVYGIGDWVGEAKAIRSRQ